MEAGFRAPRPAELARTAPTSPAAKKQPYQATPAGCWGYMTANPAGAGSSPSPSQTLPCSLAADGPDRVPKPQCHEMPGNADPTGPLRSPQYRHHPPHEHPPARCIGDTELGPMGDVIELVSPYQSAREVVSGLVEPVVPSQCVPPFM